MNERIEKLALDAGLLNYVDNETPRRCFIDGHADLEEVEKFAESIVQEAIAVVNKRYMGDNNREDMEVRRCVEDLKKHFGVE
jgi:Cft2 family RNA processing exonuclease